MDPDREVPDIVSLILPAAYTYGAVIACAEAGVRVVSCEKPIAAELSKADEMVRVCRERGTLLGCGQAAWGTPYMPDAIEWNARPTPPIDNHNPSKMRSVVTAHRQATADDEGISL